MNTPVPTNPTPLPPWVDAALPTRPAPACPACVEALFRGEAVHCSCMRISAYDAKPGW